MSIETWEKEFYPISARAAAWKGALAACEHSYRKWIGLRKKNLEKHGLTRLPPKELLGAGAVVVAGKGVWKSNGQKGFLVNADSCSLCFRFHFRDGNCKKCPLSLVRGNIPCDKYRRRETFSPFHAFTQDNDPEPMIRWLRKAITFCKRVEAQKRKKTR